MGRPTGTRTICWLSIFSTPSSVASRISSLRSFHSSSWLLRSSPLLCFVSFFNLSIVLFAVLCFFCWNHVDSWFQWTKQHPFVRSFDMTKRVITIDYKVFWYLKLVYSVPVHSYNSRGRLDSENPSDLSVVEEPLLSQGDPSCWQLKDLVSLATPNHNSPTHSMLRSIPNSITYNEILKGLNRRELWIRTIQNIS